MKPRSASSKFLTRETQLIFLSLRKHFTYTEKTLQKLREYFLTLDSELYKLLNKDFGWGWFLCFDQIFVETLP